VAALLARCPAWRGDFCRLDEFELADIHHVGIVTGMEGGEPLIARHTPNQRGVTLHNRQTGPPKLVDGQPNVLVWIAVPNLAEGVHHGHGRGPAEHDAAHGRSMP
jgi:hypothetical protein